MNTGGLQKVTIDRHDDHTASIKLGEDKKDVSWRESD